MSRARAERLVLDLTLSRVEKPFRLPLTTAGESENARSKRDDAGGDDGDGGAEQPGRAEQPARPVSG